MSSSESNSQGLSTLLREYMSREPSYTFRFKWEEEKMEKRSFKPVKIIACLSFVLIFALVGVGVFKGGSGKNPTNLGFMITAYASDETADKGKTLGYKVTGLNQCGPLVTVEEEALHFDRITLSITGKDIESYDVKAAFGELTFFDSQNRLTSENVFEGEAAYTYFVKGSELVKLPLASVSNPDETQLYWYPDKDRLMSEVDESREVFSQQKAKLKTAEDFNRYFADTVTVTVTYIDGRTESADIEITFDSKGYVSALVKDKSDVISLY